MEARIVTRGRNATNQAYFMCIFLIRIERPANSV
ncbi:hypothetical protein BDSB_23465 [Burkholderia dolosa PC543]|nr:hypothetical protein BDSB_23465 [Burkholderia dolosa PC543]